MADIILKDTNKFIMIVHGDSRKDEHELAKAMSWPIESTLVQSARKQVVQTLNLTEVFNNLNNGVLLLDITYNAVYGMKDLSPKIHGLQSKLLSTMDESLAITQGFKTATAETVAKFIQAYGFLTKALYVKLPPEKNGIAQAYRVFEEIMATARQMNKDANALAKEFAELRNSTSDTNKLIINRQDIKYAERDEMLRKLNEMKAQVDGLQQIKDDLDSEIDEYTQEHSNLSRRAQKQDERAFGLALTSAIVGGVTGIIGALIPIGSNAKSDSPAAGGGQAQGGVVSGGGESDISKKQTESESKEKALQAEIDELNKKITDVNSKLDTEGADKEALLKEKDRLTSERVEKQKELDAARELTRVFKQAAQGVVSGLNVTSGKLEKMSDDLGSSADRLYERIDKIAAQKASLSRERRETIKQLATLTKSVEQGTIAEADLQVAINSLITAVGCMRLIEVYLSDIALFWLNVEKFCQRLVESIKSINEYTGTFIDIENYTEFFTDEDFMRMYLINVASWVALHHVSAEYVDAFNSTRKVHQKAMGESGGGREKSWEIARTRAAEMSGIFDSQLADMG
ncbi:MAG: hypothetical protein FWG87_09000 [Defluviitaleaceae bacterium]|nr:hypothetical protein [Defluviitaleaceae bacterium]